MKKLWLLAGILILGVVVLWLFVGRNRHPDTSSVAPFAPYAEIRGDITPTWSPDDKDVTYCNGGQEEAKLYIVSANGGPPKPFFSGKSYACLPAWSPDGARVAFGSDRSGKFHLMRALGLESPVGCTLRTRDSRFCRSTGLFCRGARPAICACLSL